MKKIGRNDLCTCGSNKKYKKCCGEEKKTNLRKDISPQELRNRFKNIWLNSLCGCMAPEALQDECSKKMIESHTISKSASLIPLSENGHVYIIENNIYAKSKAELLNITEKGIRKTSINKLFCSFHDKSLFADIEDNKKEEELSECQLFLHTYRNFANELFKLKRALRFQQEIKNTIAEDINSLKNCEEGVRDMEEQKLDLDFILLSSNFKDFRYVLVEIENDFNYLVSAYSTPDFTFGKDNIDFDFYGSKPSISITMFYDGNRKYLLFSWLKKYESEIFIKSLLRVIHEKNFSLYLFKFLISSTENIAFRKSFFDSLEDSIKNAILEEYAPQKYPQPIEYSNLESAYPFIEAWTILNIKSNSEFFL